MTTDAGSGAAPRRTAREALSSIRLRIVAGYVVLLTLALLVALLITRQVQLTRLEEDVQDDMAQEIEELRSLTTSEDPVTGQLNFADDPHAIFERFLDQNVPGPGESYFTFVDGRQYNYSFDAMIELLDEPSTRRAWADAVEPTHLDIRTDRGVVHSIAVPLTAGGETRGVFVVANLPADQRDDVADMIRLLAFVGLGVLAVSTAVAWSLAGRVLTPVRELTRTARAITDSDLSARIPVTGHDELAQLGTTFNGMVDRLEHSMQTQRRFLDDVAHDLRTPITIARGHLEVVGDDPAEREEAVSIVVDELDRMSRYVSDLLVLAKADHPDFLQHHPVDLGEFATDLIARIKALGDRRFVLDAAPPVGRVAALADPDRLAQAMLNLATNAVQHTTDGDEIGIGVVASATHAMLWVRDTGPGVEPGTDLFDRFERGATSRSRRPEGMGLGLSIVGAIAAAHGGSVDVTSRPGAGATFTLTIPLDTTPGDDPS